MGTPCPACLLSSRVHRPVPSKPEVPPLHSTHEPQGGPGTHVQRVLGVPRLWCWQEGLSVSEKVELMRQRQMRNFMVALMVSQVRLKTRGRLANACQALVAWAAYCPTKAGLDSWNLTLSSALFSHSLLPPLLTLSPPPLPYTLLSALLSLSPHSPVSTLLPPCVWCRVSPWYSWATSMGTPKEETTTRTAMTLRCANTPAPVATFPYHLCHSLSAQWGLSALPAWL